MTSDTEMDDFDDSGELTTPEEVLRKMTSSWQNELNSPALLPTQMELVDILLDQIQGMEENIGRQTNRIGQLRISVHRMELHRISFITSDYVRCRLQKIESNPNDVLEEDKKRKEAGKLPLLSETEKQFAEEYALAEAELFEKTVLEFMPAALKKIPVPRPDTSNDMVYAKVMVDDVGHVAIPDWTDLNSEVILEMEKTSCHLIPFDSVKELIEDGKIQLL